MTNLSQLPSIKNKKKKRLGRGWASGKGKYSTRGIKGQKARGKVALMFEGGQAILSKRLPMLRGKGKNKSLQPEPVILNVIDLEKSTKIKNGMIISTLFLIKSGIIKEPKKKQTVKLLGKGKLKKKLIIEIKSSAKAVEKVKESGGEYRY